MTLDDLFPAVDPGHKPAGRKVLVQLRRTMERTRGGIILPDEERDAREVTETCGKVIALGPMAFRDAETGQLWPNPQQPREPSDGFDGFLIAQPSRGTWCDIGDLTRWTKYGGDKFQVNGTWFKFFDDRDLIAKVDLAYLSR